VVIRLLPYTVIILMFFSGAFLYKKSFSFESSYKFSKDVTRRNIDRFAKWCKKEITSTQTEAFLKKAGIKMSAFLYQFLRYSALVAWLAYITYLRLISGGNVNVSLVLWLIILILSRPSPKLLRFKSPFLFVCELISKKNKDTSNVEIARCLSQLKNIAISMSDKALSSDYIIREITKYTKITKPHFLRLLGFWCEGRYKEGQEYFSNAIGTEEAKSLAGLLGKLDYLTLDKFISQIEVYQNQVEEQRKTTVKKYRESQGNIVFLIALLSGIVILLNFLVVVVGIDAISMLQKVSF